MDNSEGRNRGSYRRVANYRRDVDSFALPRNLSFHRERGRLPPVSRAIRSPSRWLVRRDWPIQFCLWKRVRRDRRPTGGPVECHRSKGWNYVAVRFFSTKHPNPVDFEKPLLMESNLRENGFFDSDRVSVA